MRDYLKQQRAIRRQAKLSLVFYGFVVIILAILLALVD